MVIAAEARNVGPVEIRCADELWDGEMGCFWAGNTAILILRINGQFHAYQGHCPHQGAALAEGEFDGEFITCAAHRWQFDARNGRGVNPKSACLKRFPVHVVERKVFVEVDPGSVNGEPQPHSCCDGLNESRDA